MKVLTVVGARPHFIKAAPVSRALASAGVEEVLLHTGQHHDAQLTDVFFAELSIPDPTHHLGIHGGTHGVMTGRMLKAIENVLIEDRPSLVLLYGDTNSTLAGALAASKLTIPIAHVEAGLRSFSRGMPEEINRKVCDHLSTLLFCPTSASVRNLRAEGIERGVHLVGDVMYDAALSLGREARARSNILSDLGIEDGRYSVTTIHRAENTDNRERLETLLAYLKKHAADQTMVFPVHPRTRAAIQHHGADVSDLRVLPPLGYLDMTRLIQGASTIYTDSGGLQKEAYFHRVPCVTLRDETEWVETIECGWNRLWSEPTYRERREIHEYGDGTAADKIAAVLEAFHPS